MKLPCACRVSSTIEEVSLDAHCFRIRNRFQWRNLIGKGLHPDSFCCSLRSGTEKIIPWWNILKIKLAPVWLWIVKQTFKLLYPIWIHSLTKTWEPATGNHTTNNIPFKSDAQPASDRVTRYPCPILKFVKINIGELEPLVFLRRNQTMLLACADLMIPKSWYGEHLLFTIDLKVVNQRTDLVAWPMRYLELNIARVLYSLFLDLLALCSSY